MNNAEYILNFLNNELSSEEEQEFFRLLYNDIDLRNEYKCTVKLGNSISKNLNRFAPSMELTASIFAANGLKMPGSTPIEPIPTRRLPFTSSRGFIAIVSSIVTFVSSLLLFTFVDNFQESENFASLNTASELNNQNQARVNLNGLDFRKNQELRRAAVIKKIFPDKDKADDISLTKTGQFNHQRAEAKVPMNLSDFNESDQIKQRLIQDKTDEIFSKIAYDAKTIKQINLESNPVKNIIGNDKSGISIESYGFISWNIPTEQINPEKFSKLNNMELSLFYEAAQWLSLGLTVRQETFYVEYTGSENKLYYLYQQQPNLTSYSISARFFPFQFSGFRPYFQTSAGLNTAGQVIRGGIGINFPLTIDFDLFTGGEFDYFMFNHSGDSFTAEKSGLFFGLGYNF